MVASKSNDYKKGSGEFMGLTLVAIFVTYIIILLASFLQLSYSLNQLGRALTVAGRSAAICTSMDDAKKQANLVAESAINTLNIKNLSIDVDYATDKEEWESGNYLIVTIKGDISTMEPITSGSRSKSMLVTVENANVNGPVIYLPEGMGGITTYTNYTYFFPKWSMGTKQRELALIWDQKGRQSEDDVATIDGYYLIACTSTFGNVGDKLCFEFEDGTRIYCIMADEKRQTDAGANKWGHENGKCVIEMEVVGPMTSALVPGGNWKKPAWHQHVVKCINLGPYI